MKRAILKIKTVLLWLGSSENSLRNPVSKEDLEILGIKRKRRIQSLVMSVRSLDIYNQNVFFSTSSRKM